MAKRDHAGDLRAFVDGADARTILDALRSLPPDIDPDLAARVANKLLDGSYLPRELRLLPAGAVRQVLAKERVEWEHVFLQLAVDVDAKDAVVVTQWQAGLAALGDLNLTYAWRSKQRRERFRKLAKSPRLLQAIQGTAANRAVPLDLLAVLVADASAESLDALVPHLDGALVAQDVRLERVTRLEDHAKSTPALRAIFGEIDATLCARNALSPALAFGERIGLGKLLGLWFSASMWSQQTNARVPRLQGSVQVDSRKARWFSISITEIDAGSNMRHTVFDADAVHVDQLGIGVTTADELPGYFARIAKRFNVQWAPPVPRGNMRGKKRDLIARWLASG